MCLCLNNFIFIFVQWKLKKLEGDVWVVSLYITKRLNNCFNCTRKLNERPSSSSRVLGCPASPPLCVYWLVHLRWKKTKTFKVVVGKCCCRSKKIEICMFYLELLLLLLLLLWLLLLHRSSQIIFKQPIVFVIYYLAFSARHFR